MSDKRERDKGFDDQENWEEFDRSIKRKKKGKRKQSKNWRDWDYESED